MKSGLFALSADPITFGHLDVILKAAQHADELDVVIFENETKKGQQLFSEQDRLRMAIHSIQHFCPEHNINVTTASGLLVDYVMKNDYYKVYRGIRNDRDREEELIQREINSFYYREYMDKVVFLTPDEDKKTISSTLVKNLVRAGLDVSTMVPPMVNAELRYLIHGKVLVGVTGNIAVGKTKVCNDLKGTRFSGGGVISHIAVDDIQRQLYAENSLGAKAVWSEIANLLGTGEVLNQDGIFNGAAYKQIFPSVSAINKFKISARVTPHIFRLIREAVNKAPPGIILLEWAGLVENKLTRMVCNNVLLVDSPNQAEYIAARGIDPAYLAAVQTNQTPVKQKFSALKNLAFTDGYGTVLVYENSDGNSIHGLLSSLLKMIPGSPP